MKLKTVISLIIVIFLISFLTIGCEYQKVVINQEDINKFNSDLADWKNYVDKVMTIGDKHTINIQNFNKTLEESAQNNDDFLNAYRPSLKEYEDWSNELSNITPPNIADDAHYYLLEFLRLAQVRASNLISYCEGSNPNYDTGEDNKILQQAQDAENKSRSEYDKIYKYFNIEAEKLRLKKPFKDY